jgi:hypothetical protein
LRAGFPFVFHAHIFIPSREIRQNNIARILISGMQVLVRNGFRFWLCFRGISEHQDGNMDIRDEDYFGQTLSKTGRERLVVYQA